MNLVLCRSLELDLAPPVIPDQSISKVLSTKIEIKLKKEVGIRWTTLEGSGEMPTVSSIPTSVLNPQQPPTYPSAKGKNWDRIAVLNFVASNHTNSIVRTKACIILSRTSNGLHFTETVCEWSINILRQLIARDWDNINHNITPRWCISILNCFADINSVNF